MQLIMFESENAHARRTDGIMPLGQARQRGRGLFTPGRRLIPQPIHTGCRARLVPRHAGERRPPLMQIHANRAAGTAALAKPLNQGRLRDSKNARIVIVVSQPRASSVALFFGFLARRRKISALWSRSAT